MICTSTFARHRFCESTVNETYAIRTATHIHTHIILNLLQTPPILPSQKSVYFSTFGFVFVFDNKNRFQGPAVQKWAITMFYARFMSAL